MKIQLKTLCWYEVCVTHLESAHVAWVASVLQTVLVALHEKLEEKSETINRNTDTLIEDKICRKLVMESCE